VLSAHGVIAARNAEVEELFGEFRIPQTQEEQHHGECRQGLKSRARRRKQTKVEAFEFWKIFPRLGRKCASLGGSTTVIRSTGEGDLDRWVARPRESRRSAQEGQI